MENTVKADTRKRKYTQQERMLAILVSALIIITGLAAAFFIFKYISERNAPPRTYYDYQLRIWRSMLEKSPKDPAVHTNLGYVYMKKGDEATGLSYFNQALKLDKNFVPALYNIGMYYKKHGRKEQAVSYLERAGKQAVEGNKYLAYYSLGELYVKDKEYDKAIESIKLSLDDNPTIWNSYEQLGLIYESRGDKTQALENYKKALSFNTGNDNLKRKVDKLTNGNPSSN